MGTPSIVQVYPADLAALTVRISIFDATYTDSVDGLVASSVVIEIDTADTFDTANKITSTFTSIASGHTCQTCVIIANGTWYWRATATNTDGTTVSATRSLTVAQTLKRILYLSESITKLDVFTNKRTLSLIENISKLDVFTDTRALYEYENITGDPPAPWIDYLSRTIVAPSESITIYGSGFGYGSGDDTENADRTLRQYGGKVLVNDVVIGAIVWGWEEISIQIPGDTEPGVYTLQVTLDKPTASGLRESKVFVIEVIEAIVGEDFFIEYKVFDRLSLTFPVAVLESSAGRSFQKQLNSPGSGMLTVNRDDAKLAELTMGRIVKCYFNQVERFAWVIENISPQYVNANMQNMVPISGRGVLSLLEYAIVYPESYPAQTTLERSWSDVFGAVILLELLTEAQGRGTLMDVTVDFTATEDSDGIPWEMEYEDKEISFTCHSGETLLSIVGKLTELGALEIEMSSSLVLHAYRDRISNYGVVLEPVTGLLEHTRVIKGASIVTSLLGEGADGEISVQEDTPAINEYGRREGYLMARDLSDINLVYYTNKTLYLHNSPEWSDQISVDVYPFAPFVHYDVGDYVALREPSADGLTIGAQGTPIDATSPIGTSVRVVAITISADDNGKIETALDLNDFILDQEVKLQQWMDNLSHGSVDTTLSSESSEPKAAYDHNHDADYSDIAHTHEHSDLTGLGDDDHTQYLNTTRHDSDDHSGLAFVASLKKTAGTALTGAIELVAGGGIILTQSDENKTITIESASGSSNLLVEYTVAGSAVTSIDFTGLDINTHKSYHIEFSFINATAGAVYCSLYVNNDTTDANYYVQYINSSNTTLASARSNNAGVINVAASKSSFMAGTIGLTNGLFGAILETIRDLTSTIQIKKAVVCNTSSLANITRLTLTASAASAIGVGSTVRIYRGDV